MTVSDVLSAGRRIGNRCNESAAPNGACLFPARNGCYSPITRARQTRSMAIYACAFMLAIGLIALSAQPNIQALALGLIVPGGGFLFWAGPDNPMQLLAIGLFVASLLLFLVAIVIWFATGNVLLPFTVWLAAAIGAASGGVIRPGGTSEHIWQSSVQVVPLNVIALIGLAGAAALLARRRGARRRDQLNAYLQSLEAKSILVSEPRDPAGDELSKDDLQLMRLVLDRALQPVTDFAGFEWIDQFQTAAVRYQLNFMSYALSVAQAVHVPAFQGYFHTAQENLIAKQQDHRIWRYWKLENMWGNLRSRADPIPRDNIMFTGFLAAQIAYYQSATAKRIFDTPGSLLFEQPSGERYAYSLPELIDLLTRGYQQSEYGLLACEPNWIYPLCNTITASAIRAFDAATGTRHWDGIEDSFRHRLETEFLTAGGQFVSCRSTYTGFAAPLIGGAAMQGFPCLFLNAVFPDIAQRHWLILRRDLAGPNWRRTLMPVDVGNYRFSRASSYAATAAAAVEMGDSEVAQRVLLALDEEYPQQVSGHVANRANASLLAHAVELIARSGCAGTLRSLAMTPRRASTPGPFIKEAGYPDVLVAKATNADGSLRVVLYPGERTGVKSLTIGGLAPHQSYVTLRGAEYHFTADAAGDARLNLLLNGRTELRIARTV